jgi:hypothetical protein
MVEQVQQEPQGFQPQDIAESYKKQAEIASQVPVEKAKAQAAYDAQQSGYIRGLDTKFQSQMQPTPEFKPSKESAQDLVALFGMIGAIGAMGGGKSYGNALGAMQGMTGMLNGYNQGRKDLFEREKAEFDKNMQAVKAHNDQITQAFDRAVKMAPYNLTTAKNKLSQELAGLDAKVLRAQLETQGIEKTAQVWNQANTAATQRINAQTAQLNALSASQRLQQQSAGEQIGAKATLSKLIDVPIGANLSPKEAETIVNKIYTLSNTLQLVREAKDPDIKFGELSKYGTNFDAAIRRNVTSGGGTSSATETNSIIDKSIADSGMDPNDKNVVFYKKALFTAMELERQARGGSILPQGIFTRLTPLLDPSKTTKEAFVGIFNDRAREVAQSSGLSREQLDKALNNLGSQNYMFDGSQPAPPKPAAATGGKPSLQEFLQKAKQANPNTSDQELIDYYNKKYGSQ